MVDLASQPDRGLTGDWPRRVRWLTRLRWAAIVGQSITILVADLAFDLPIGWTPLWVIVALEVAMSVAAQLVERRSGAPSARLVAAMLVFDVVALTGLLFFSGGPSNPFNFLYLVHIVLASITVGPRFGWALTALGAAGFALLFLGPGNEHLHHALMPLHLQGMWVAFVVAAILVVYFVRQITRDLDAHRRALADASDRMHAAQRLTTVTMLATGAAHELATPLSTIAVVAKEIVHRVRARGGDDALAEDATLLRDQVGRCQAIVDQLMASAGQSIGELVTSSTAVDALSPRLDALPASARGRVRLVGESGDRRVALPWTAIGQAVVALVDNGLRATEAGSVTVRAVVRNGGLEVMVDDDGPGIPATIRNRVREPFVTTRPTGEGMGLGLFLVDRIASELSGSLTLDAGQDGHGTRAILTIPLSVSPPEGA